MGDDQIRESNAASREEIRNSNLEYMAELEAKRLEVENLRTFSVKANWERLIEKRKTPQVLRKLSLPQLQ